MPTFRPSSTGGPKRLEWCRRSLESRGAEGRRRLMVPLERRARLGDARVQRPVAALGEQLVGLDR